MNRIIYSLLFISFLFFYSNNLISQVGKSYKLKISINCEFEYGLITKSRLTNKNFSSSKNWEFDTKSNSICYYWDSLMKGNYKFNLKSDFGSEQLVNFMLTKDTVINIIKPFNVEIANIITKEEMMKGDSIVLLYKSNGCFHSTYKKSILIKNKNGLFDLKIYGNERKKLLMKQNNISTQIIDSIYNLEIDCNQSPKKYYKNGLYIGGSTTSQYFHLIANNKVYLFSDDGLSNYKFNNFLTNFIKEN